MDLFKMLQGQLTNNNQVQQLTQQVGGADAQQTQQATNGIFSAFIGALSNNAKDPEKAQQLDKALERDHDGSLLSNLGSLFGGGAEGGLSGLMKNLPFGGNQQAPQQNANVTARTTNGNKIVQHVFGDQQQQVVQNVSQQSGLSTNKVSNLMTTLAPIVMSMLGQQKKEQNLDAQGVANMLQNEKQSLKQNNQAAGMLSFLDSDGDGDVDMGDISGFMKKLF